MTKPKALRSIKMRTFISSDLLLNLHRLAEQLSIMPVTTVLSLQNIIRMETYNGQKPQEHVVILPSTDALQRMKMTMYTLPVISMQMPILELTNSIQLDVQISLLQNMM